MNVLDRAIAELADIELQISSLAKRREQLRSFVDFGVALYQQDGNAAVNGHTYVATAPATASANGVKTAKDAIVESTRKLLTDSQPVHTRDLVPLLEGAGIKIGSQDKVNAVSVVLSKSGLFKGSRKHGWSLLSPHEEKPQQAR